MKVKACRGVCVGVERHLVAGEVADLDAAQVQFLVSIGAVEVVEIEKEETEKAPEKKSIEADAPHERSKSAKGKG